MPCHLAMNAATAWGVAGGLAGVLPTGWAVGWWGTPEAWAAVVVCVLAPMLAMIGGANRPGWVYQAS